MVKLTLIKKLFLDLVESEEMVSMEVWSLTPINEDLISNAVEKVEKSIVNIASVRMVQDQLFHLFPVEGVGSGVVIDNAGLVLTNNHELI